MSENKTQPTKQSVDEFLETVSKERRAEAKQLIALMHRISGEQPVMWGPSVIGFGSQHYHYDTGREGDMPLLSFSPRKAAITIYVMEGFQNYSAELAQLGKYKSSVSCLYINKLADADLEVLSRMLEQSYTGTHQPAAKPTTVDEYIAQIPPAAHQQFAALRQIVHTQLPDAEEVLSYGIVGYKVDAKRARVYISGWKDHVAMYPIPKDAALQQTLKPYTKGKGTLWFTLDKPLPEALIEKTVRELAS